MAAPGSEGTSATADWAEKELLAVLAREEHTLGEIDVLLANYRSACEASMFGDFSIAGAYDTESRLWNTHNIINNKYRLLLARFRDAEGKKRPVERRKLEKHYLNFIKSGQKFYRAYIERLASHPNAPKEVREVALKLHLNSWSPLPPNDVLADKAVLSVGPAIEPSLQETQLILESCHESLVHLGDLSRYRETEIVTKQRNWAPALGYYDLAATVRPSSGFPHNQKAIIALKDENHMRALYYLYRALTVQFPYPRARANLNLEFKKVLDRKSKDLLFPKGPQQQPGDVLQAWYVYLHARLHAGVSFPEHEELENEVLTNLSVELKERPLDGLLNRFALSSMAAQHLGSSKPADCDQGQVFVFFLRFNVKTFFTLLQILLPELEQIVAEDDELDRDPSFRDVSDRISATARRILPCLRQYSSWLVSNASHLVALDNHELVGVQITEFWRIYANALTLLAATFRKSDLPTIDYLLAEDEDTIAFTPFTNPHTLRRYFQADGATVKARSSDQTVQRHHPSVEMLSRVRGLLEDGVELVTGTKESSQCSVPLILVEDTRFEFKEKGLPLEPSFNKSHSHSHSATSINLDDIERAKRYSMPSRRPTDIPEDASESVAPSISTNTTMCRMVDGLVASEVAETHEPSPHFPQISHGESPPTPTEEEFEDKNYQDFKSVPNFQPMEALENIRPVLPSIWNSPFAPRPGETDSPHSRPSTAHKHYVTTSASTSNALASSNARFQETLFRQQQELEMQQSSYDLPTTASTQPPPGSVINPRFLAREESPMLSPFASSPVAPLPTYPSYDVPRKITMQGRFGAIGEIPPSGQGG